MAKKKFSQEDADDIVNYQNSTNVHVPTLNNTKIEIKCKNENQKSFLKLIEQKEIILCSGPAGCGKTYLACLQALKSLKDDKRYKKIILVKSVTTLEGEEIGFLKGGMEEKMEPFIYSFMNNFKKIIPESLLKLMRDAGMIEVMPVAYCRGINFDNSIVIIDEAQNLTKDHIKTLMTRIGYDAKLIILGDTEQIDRKKKTESSLKWIIDKFKVLNEIGTFEFTNEDIVRNPIISKILEIYNEEE